MALIVSVVSEVERTNAQSSDMETISLRSNVPLMETEPNILAYSAPQVAAYMSKTLKNIETLYVGAGIHFIQEDRPHEIGRGLADWMRRHK